MPEIRVSVRLRGFDLHYEGSLAFFERVVDPTLAQVVPYPGRTPSGAPAPTPQAAPQAIPVAPPVIEPVVQGYRPTSPEFRAFLQRLGPEAGEPDRQVLAMAFYLWNYEKKDHVSEGEIEGCFRAIGIPVPPGIDSLYEDLAQRLRFLLPGPSKGTWTLTQKGANYVKTRLLGNI
jgi:hypothetical protein